MCPKPVHFPALTGLRAIAAYLVFLHHYNPATPGTFVYRLMQQGYVGVTVFFMLSGFLIYHWYADAYVKRRNWSWRKYLQNRFARIIPLYVLLLLLTVGINVTQSHLLSGIALLLNLTLLKGFVAHYKFSGLPQSWSLTVEVCFYMVAPLLFRPIKHRRLFIIPATLVISGGLIWQLSRTFSTNDTRNYVDSLSFVLFYTFPGRSFEFIAGIWLARRWRQNRLPSGGATPIAGLLLCACCLLW